MAERKIKVSIPLPSGQEFGVQIKKERWEYCKEELLEEIAAVRLQIHDLFTFARDNESVTGMSYSASVFLHRQQIEYLMGRGISTLRHGILNLSPEEKSEWIRTAIRYTRGDIRRALRTMIHFLDENDHETFGTRIRNAFFLEKKETPYLVDVNFVFSAALDSITEERDI